MFELIRESDLQVELDAYGKPVALINGTLKLPIPGAGTAESKAALANDGYIPSDQTVGAVNVACPAGAATTVNGTIAGAGDILVNLSVTVNTSGATATLQVRDSTTGEIIVTSPGGGYASTGTFSLILNRRSLVGSWIVTCGAGLQATAGLA